MSIKGNCQRLFLGCNLCYQWCTYRSLLIDANENSLNILCTPNRALLSMHVYVDWWL